MSRITSITLDGFKDQKRDIALGPLTLLVGRNGAGKSAALEGLVYALGGEVPSGKSAERVAAYFGPGGGSVAVYDEDANFLRRSVDIGKRGKVSEDVTMEPENADLWKTNAALLNVRQFLALSAEKRRAFILELVGAGELDDVSELELLIGDATAKALAGNLATMDHLTVEKDILTLEEDIQPVARLWHEVWDQLSVVANTHRGTASQLFQRLTKAAGEMKNAARHAQKRRLAAAAELESGVRGARVAAEEIDRAKSKVSEATTVLGNEREADGAYREVVRAEADGRTQVTKLEELVKFDQDAADGFERLGEKPEPPDADPKTEVVDAEVERRTETARMLQAELSLRRDIQDGRDLLGAMDDEPVAELGAAFEELFEGLVALCPDIDPKVKMGRMAVAVAKVAKDWTTRRRKVAAKLKKLSEQLPPDPPGLVAGPDLQERYEVVEEKRKLAVRERIKITTADSDALAEYKRALKAWENEMEARHYLLTRLGENGTRLAAAKKAHQKAVTRLRETKAANVEGAKKTLQAAKEELQRAQTAAGEVRAYEQAQAGALADGYEQEMWKAVESACKSAREVYVADVAKPLVEDIQAILEDVGRPEGVKLELETSTGRAIFDLGWVRDGHYVSVDALSAGEAAIFLTALVVAISRRSKGRRILLLEADPLNRENLALLLGAISRLPDAWDACIVATKEDSVPQFDGNTSWSIIKLLGE